MQSRRLAGKYRTAFRARLIANSDDVIKLFFARDEVGDGFGLVAGDVDAVLLHRLHHDRIQLSRFNAGALGEKIIRANPVQKRLSHLAARAVVNADEEHFLFRHRGKCREHQSD